MAKLSGEQIQKVAVEIVQSKPAGIRYGELLAAVLERSPETPKNTIQGNIWNLQDTHSAQVVKPTRGLFMPVAADGPPPQAIGTIIQLPQLAPGSGDGAEAGEAKIYDPFAEWLRTDQEDVTRVGVLGGNFGKGTKWGAPDVVGVKRAGAADIIKFPLEIVTAEIKDNGGDHVVAFGQAVAYRLFSHKTFVVVSDQTAVADLDRLEALCIIHGIGLVLFDKELHFSRRLVAQRNTPDVFYVNEFVTRLKYKDDTLFRHLFD